MTIDEYIQKYVQGPNTPEEKKSKLPTVANPEATVPQTVGCPSFALAIIPVGEEAGIHNQPIEHPYVGKFVDLDFRTSAFGMPYDASNRCVWQNAFVSKVSKGADGEMVHIGNHNPLPFSIRKVIKVHDKLDQVS